MTNQNPFASQYPIFQGNPTNPYDSGIMPPPTAGPGPPGPPPDPFLSDRYGTQWGPGPMGPPPQPFDASQSNRYGTQWGPPTVGTPMIPMTGIPQHPGMRGPPGPPPPGGPWQTTPSQGSMPPSMPPLTGPWQTIPPSGPMPPPHIPMSPPRTGGFQQNPMAAAAFEAAAANEVSDRLRMALDKKKELSNTLHQLTRGGYTGDQQEHSLVKKAHLDGVDGRVMRLIYCKDPYYNQELKSATAAEVQQRKMEDAVVLEEELSREANQSWAKALYGDRGYIPPEEMAAPSVPYVVSNQAVPFIEVHPNYSACEDVWGRKLELRSLSEAMAGDVSKPLPRPVLFDEDYSDFRSGKYLKDDCPIA